MIQNIVDRLFENGDLSQPKQNGYSQYVVNLASFYSKLLSYTRSIFKVSGYELELLLEEYNLLSHPENCLSSSTAIGYILEEFLVSKLEVFTEDHKPGTGEYQINRKPGSTTGGSYDCFSILDNTKRTQVLINIKGYRSGRQNNAVAAINQLYKDYVLDNPDQEKCFLVLKLCYDIRQSKRDTKQKIIVEDIGAYYLEEYDLLTGTSQDHRNWSDKSNFNAGRLILSDAQREQHLLPTKQISYKSTCGMIERIYQNNIKKDNEKNRSQ